MVEATLESLVEVKLEGFADAVVDPRGMVYFDCTDLADDEMKKILLTARRSERMTVAGGRRYLPSNLVRRSAPRRVRKRIDVLVGRCRELATGFPGPHAGVNEFRKVAK